MTQASIKALRIRGLRCIDELDLALDGLTVLVGSNGSGKSSILEALELCRRLASGDFLSSLNAIHGGLASILRHGATQLSFHVQLEMTETGRAPVLTQYGLGLSVTGTGTGVAEVFWIEGPARRTIFDRGGPDEQVWNGTELVPLTTIVSPKRMRAELLLTELSGALAPHPAINAMRDALAGIEVHLPFEVTPSWAARAHQRPSATRGSVLLQPAERLAVFGSNLANAFHTLRNERPREHWEATMDLVRMGLGGHIESVNTRADAGGGAIAIAVEIRDQAELLPAYALSDGQLAYLCFVAMVRLDAERTLLAFDEPEAHMHPELLVRIVQLLEEMALTHPVIIATHSDVLLDALSDPANSIRVCELHDGATRLRQLDEPALHKWIERYRGVGQLRSEGHLAALLTRPKGPRAHTRPEGPAGLSG